MAAMEEGTWLAEFFEKGRKAKEKRIRLERAQALIRGWLVGAGEARKCEWRAFAHAGAPAGAHTVFWAAVPARVSPRAWMSRLFRA